VKLKICKSTLPICKPEERADRYIPVKSVDGVPVGNDLAIAVYNNPEAHAGKYELIT